MSAKLATCSLNLWALDFQGNYEKILESIRVAKINNAHFRLGTELEIVGYSAQDHFLESDTFLHSWQVLGDLLIHSDAQDIVICVGMPVSHKNTSYNCAVFILNKQILFIRPKQNLCDDHNYRESRWFSPWSKIRQIELCYLPTMISEITGQKSVPFGDAVLATRDSCIGIEMCEELWTADSPHVWMGLDGVEIFANPSASHFELRKAYYTIDLIKNATAKNGGVYLFANQRGGDGDRLYMNGNCCVSLNGKIIAQSDQFSMKDVEVICVSVDLEEVRTYRNQIRSSRMRSTTSKCYPRIEVDFCISSSASFPLYTLIDYKPLSAEEEIAYIPACYLWDYLRRSGQGGYFLPLSGGRDSASVACIVYSMCKMVFGACSSDNSIVLTDLSKILGVYPEIYFPNSVEDLCSKLLFTCYIASENSSKDSHERAAAFANQIGSSHLKISISKIINAFIDVVVGLFTVAPKFRVNGGSTRENLALQNLQARIRMVVSYLLAQLQLWAKNRPGSLLVLGTANVDESLRGYMTKYDCSSADVNPIGSISKQDLESFLCFCLNKWNLTSLGNILTAVPTAELEPMENGVAVQADEIDMGMTYKELSMYGKLRIPGYCGPYSMFCRLVNVWGDRMDPVEISDKVKHFFRSYAINRHKMTVLTPSIHCETYSPDDNRHDHRPFLYNVNWPFQFKQIDKKVGELM